MRERGLFPQDIPVLNVIVSVTSVAGTFQTHLIGFV